jgi:transcription termination/antitermination protein NusG
VGEGVPMTNPSSINDIRWFAVCTRARHERVAYQQLVQHDVEAFLPTIRRWSTWSDRRKSIEWPLFPGYCFARFDRTRSLTVVNCASVLSIVSMAGEPAPVSDDEINGIRFIIDSQLPYEPHPPARDGATVDVVRGPLKGLRGRLLRTQASRASIVLSVDLIAQGVRVEVPLADVALD